MLGVKGTFAWSNSIAEAFEDGLLGGEFPLLTPTEISLSVRLAQSHEEKMLWYQPHLEIPYDNIAFLNLTTSWRLT